MLTALALVASMAIEPTGHCDDTAINAAIAAAPDGGTVDLAPGTFDICNEQWWREGGVRIERSNITLAGAGAGRTILRLADGTDTNVIRIGTDDSFHARPVHDVTIRDLSCDGNFSANAPDEVAPGSRMEGSCVRAAGPEPIAGITVERVHFFACPYMCVQLVGQDVVVSNSSFGDARFAVVEIAGSGAVTGNSVTISGEIPFVFRADGPRGVDISGNRVTVTESGRVGTVFRSNPGWGVTLSGNALTLHGTVDAVEDIRSDLSQ